MIIYKVTNTLNGKVYVGQTRQKLRQRWADHLKDSRKQVNNKFYNALCKYGAEHFKIEPIEIGIRSKQDLNERERYWIAFYDSRRNGYNSTDGGEESPMTQASIRAKVSASHKGKVFSAEHCLNISIAKRGTPGRPHSDETKQRISQAHKGVKKSHNHVENMRKANLGKTQSQETRKKRSDAMKGRPKSEEHRNRISESLKGNSHVMAGSDNVRSRAVEQVNIETNEIIKVHESARIAELEVAGKESCAVSRAANGGRKSAYGYSWRWVETRPPGK